jgi:methionyl-tRNA synthetase
MLGIKPSRFIRTTDVDHQQAVQYLWSALRDRGDIYLGAHSGWYCSSEETFYSLHELESLPSGQRQTIKTKKLVQWVEEPNYLFRLSKYRQNIVDWLRSGRVEIIPNGRLNDLWGFLEDKQWESSDLSVSRKFGPASWGIPVPGDPQQVVYVWLDALANYLTVLGYPHAGAHRVPDVHVIGKDIFKFHAIYWPAFLMSAGLPLPRQLVVHGHWTVDGMKISKSLGNSVDPVELVDRFGSDALRYYLLREGRLDGDNDFSTAHLIHTVNADLVNQLGNLCARAFTSQFLEAASNGNGEAWEVSDEVKNLVSEVVLETSSLFGRADFSRGLEILQKLLRIANGRFSDQKPWKLTGSSVDKDRLARLLADLSFICHAFAFMASPIIPKISASVLEKIPPLVETLKFNHFDVGNAIKVDLHAAMRSTCTNQAHVIPRLADTIKE